jgi:hypothetical protein
MGIFFFISCAVPMDHGNSSAFFALDFFGVNILLTDLFYLIIILSCLFNTFFSYTPLIDLTEIRVSKRKLVLSVFFVSVLLAFFIGIYSGHNIDNVLYALRPLLYLSLLFFNFDSKKFNIPINIFNGLMLIGFSLHVLFILSLYIFPEFSFYFSDLTESSGLGRIAFHNDFLIFFIFPLLYPFYMAQRSIIGKVILYFLVVLFLLKLVISMGRGNIIFLILGYISYNIFKSKFFSFDVIWKLSKFFPIAFFSFLLLNNYILPLIWGDNYDLFLDIYKGRFLNYGDDDFQDTHVSNRLIMWLAGLKEFFGSPFLGHGLGYMFAIDSSEWSSGKVFFVDSSLLTILIKLGLFGTIPLVYYLFVILKDSIRGIEYSIDRSFFHQHRIAYFKGLIGFYIFSLFNSLLVSSPAIFAFVMIVLYNKKSE